MNSLAAASGIPAQQGRDQLGRVAKAAWPACGLSRGKSSSRSDRTQGPSCLSELSPCCRSGQRQSTPAGFARGSFERWTLSGLLESQLQGAVPLALDAVMNALRSLRPAGFQPREKGRERLAVSFVADPFRGGEPQAGQQDIQVAHFAEQPGQPFQFSLDLLAPSGGDHVLECAQLATKPAGGGSQAMYSLPIATPGLGLEQLQSV